MPTGLESQILFPTFPLPSYISSNRYITQCPFFSCRRSQSTRMSCGWFELRSLCHMWTNWLVCDQCTEWTTMFLSIWLHWPPCSVHSRTFWESVFHLHEEPNSCKGLSPAMPLHTLLQVPKPLFIFPISSSSDMSFSINAIFHLLGSAWIWLDRKKSSRMRIFAKFEP